MRCEKDARFKQFEAECWDHAYSGYHDYFQELTRQTIPELLRDTAQPGRRVLDVACGPGYVTEAAAQAGAEAYGLDFCAPMAELAKRRASGGYFLKGDAEDLPFKDGFFDAVVMNFGMLHLGRPEMAASEACRVLKPGGSFAFTVWAPPPASKAFELVLGAVGRFGAQGEALPEGPPFFAFAEPSAACALMEQAGLGSPTVMQIAMSWSFPTADALYEAFYQGTARTGALLRMQPADAAQAIRGAVAGGMAAYQGGDGVYHVPMTSVLVRAVKAA